MGVHIVIPAFNEEKSIGRVIQSLKKRGYKNIIVVDDGSTDNTVAVANDNGALVLKHFINRGQGAALKTGIDYALKKGAEIIVTFDADGQFLPEEIKKIIEPVKNGEVDISLGSRFLGKAQDIPLMKKIVLKLGILVVWMLYGIKVTDSQNGFRALSRKAAEKINITSNRMEHAGEIMGEIVQNRLRYKEVPITVIYSEYSKMRGQSWTRSFGLGIRMLLKKLAR